jgi:molybdopterin molybdotransferase
MTMIPPEEAWQRLEAVLAPLPSVVVGRRQGLGRTLAKAVRATQDLPPLDVSAMDGLALAGPVAAGTELPVAGTVAAGDPPGQTLAVGTALRIMTGAPVPTGADRVLPVEQTGPVTEDRVRILATVEAGAHIRRRAEVLSKGATLLEGGSLLTPAGLSLLAAHGHEELAVHRPPTVALLVTGDEVVPPAETPAPGQLRDTHTDFLLAAGRSLDLAFESLGIVGDDRQALAERVREGLKRDVLLITGGVSMGEFDFVEEILKDAGCRLLFDQIAVQPAKPLVAAVHPGGLVFGLPGNPASAMVAFWLFVRPALRRLLGCRDAYWHGALAAQLEAPLPPARGRDRFLPAQVRVEEGQILVTPLQPRGSHDVSAYGQGTALVRIPADSDPAAAGSPCEILPLADWRVGGG